MHEDASGGVIDNESLEFLGDSVLGFVIADLLFRDFPEHNEGQKSKLKASLVSATSLARLGERIGLGEYLILGRGEEKTGGRKKQALIADGYEALIAAIYLDGGIEPARAFIEREFETLIAEARRTGAEAAFTEDYKSALQEWLQSPRPRPARLPAGGRDRAAAPPELFEVEVLVSGGGVARADGREQEGGGAGGGEARARQPDRLNPPAAAAGSDQSISMMPQSFSRTDGAAARPAITRAGSAPRQPRPSRSACTSRARSSSPGGTGRQCSRTQSRSSGSAKL